MTPLQQAISRPGRGITSVCSAHPLVLRAALRQAAATGEPVLIEATCNQVNHQGGYTGMRPADFAALVRRLAVEERCPDRLLILGGDHLGPNPWRSLPADQALAEAEACVAAFVEAGFAKIHLDASMGCKGERAALDDATTATRAVRLVRRAEAAGTAPLYIIGTEVPPPGGADHALDGIAPTLPDAARLTVAVHARTFAEARLDDAWARVIGLVVQPGVEFGNRNVIAYDRPAAAALAALLPDLGGLVFEAHSTDYQPETALRALVLDGFRILKVGPELTFALREVLFALDLIASDLVPGYGDRPLARVMDRAMLDDPGHWQGHYAPSGEDARLMRQYSLSDRIRYYWPTPAAMAAVEALRAALTGRSIPAPLFWQHMPAAAGFADRPADPDTIIIDRIGAVLDRYRAACLGGNGGTQNDA
ncbi:MAG: class II D-tagatose-bisphosphate aldolase, non-catalytic subunit [Paracoccaceae bacterium]